MRETNVEKLEKKLSDKNDPYSESCQYLGGWRERQNLLTAYFFGVKRQYLLTTYLLGVTSVLSNDCTCSESNVSTFKRLTYSESRQYLQTAYLFRVKRQYL